MRLWALAAGRPDERGGYLLALDPHAPQTHLPLIAAATRLGIPPARVSRGPALRISGARRMRRLVELVGPAPARGSPRPSGRVTGAARTLTGSLRSRGVAWRGRCGAGANTAVGAARRVNVRT